MKHLTLLFLVAGCASPLADVTVSSADFGVLSAPGTYVDEVRVTNVGSTAATLERLERVEGPASVVVITPKVRLEPGEFTTWKVKFDAQALGLTTARFRAVFDTGTASFLVRGRLVEACAPLELDLGDARVGRTVSRAVEVSNPLDEPATVELGSLAAPFSADLSGVIELAPRETRTLTVSFKSWSEGAREQPWLVSTRTDCSPSPSIVRGRGLAAPLTLVPGRLHFGDVAAGTSSSATFELRNATREPVRVSSAQLSDSTFTFETPLPVEIAAESSVLLTVSARPATGAARNGELTLTTDAQGEAPLSLPLLVNGSRTCMAASATQLDFGTGEAGCRSAGQVVTFVNQCPHPVRVASTSVTPGFRIVAGLPSEVEVRPGASVAVQIAFTPQAAGRASGTLRAQVDVLDGTEDLAIVLGGDGTPAAIVEELYRAEKPRVDVLIVLDDGPQMLPASTSVTMGLGELVTNQADDSDLRFGVMTTSTDAASIGRLRTASGAEWLDDPTASQLQLLGALTGNQPGRSSCIEALRAAFSDPTSGPRRMRRSNAALHVICITNRADELMGPAPAAINDLRSLLPPLVRISVVAQLGSAVSCGGAVDDGTLRLWAEEMRATKSDVCTPWAYEVLPPRGHFEWRNLFFLSRHPDVSRGPLEVSLNQLTLLEGEAWSWRPEQNAVSIEPLYTPGPGDELRLRYYPECTF